MKVPFRNPRDEMGRIRANVKRGLAIKSYLPTSDHRQRLFDDTTKVRAFLYREKK